MLGERKAKAKKLAWVLIGTILLIYFSLGFNWLVLLFCIFWQVMVSIDIVRTIKVIWKVRKGPFVEGRLQRSVERSDGDGGTIYKTLIVFPLNNSKDEKRILHVSKYPPSNRYRIWVDQLQPERSIVTNYNGLIILNNLFFMAIVIGLCFVDYFHLVKIFGK
jgi:hypothetical protein